MSNLHVHNSFTEFAGLNCSNTGFKRIWSTRMNWNKRGSFWKSKMLDTCTSDLYKPPLCYSSRVSIHSVAINEFPK